MQAQKSQQLNKLTDVKNTCGEKRICDWWKKCLLKN